MQKTASLNFCTPDLHFIWQFNFRKWYYASIDHHILYDLLEQQISDPAVMRLVWQYLNRAKCYGENYREVTRGISLGCPLSPLMGALYLKPLDDRLKETGLFYARFMDDWVIITPTRWKLRKAVRMVNVTLNRLGVELHPDKTFIGRATRCFDFLGYAVSADCRVTPSAAACKNMIERITRLYEQGADLNRIGQYVRHWQAWVRGGVRGIMADAWRFMYFLYSPSSNP